jgi:2-polyprenyl-6-methoxyphenol hydroxylase-like FAD-dependent oxidoreductase
MITLDTPQYAQLAPTLLDAQPSIAIVGASLTGPALALLLAQAGITNVTVHESSPAPDAQAGGVIGLDHASLATLDTIGVPQEQIAPFPSEQVVAVHLANRREVDRTQTLYPGRNTAWHLLNDQLLRRLAPGQLHLGQRVRAITAAADGRAQLSITDAAPVSADLVVWADGRRSTGRRLLDPDRQLSYGGYVAWRGQLPGHTPDLQDYIRLQPYGASLHTFPILQRDGSAATDWTFYLNASQQEAGHLLGDDPTRRTFAHQISPQARDHVLRQAGELLPDDAVDVLAATPPARWSAAPIVDIPFPTRMVYRVGDAYAILLGDALAPVRPTTASGANGGLDQAAGLVVALSQHLHHGANLGAALGGWQQRHLPAVYAAQQLGPQLSADLGLGTRVPYLVMA